MITLHGVGHGDGENYDEDDDEYFDEITSLGHSHLSKLARPQS